MQAFPYLLQQLDALQDKFMAAAESNEILKSALEQMQQQQPPVESGFEDYARGRSSHNDRLASTQRHPTLSSEMYLRLARENYLLSAPYQVDLLMGYTGAAAFTDFPASTSMQQKAKRFPPFRVVSVVKRSENQGDEDAEHKEDAVVLAVVADANDVNGVSYLNRSKINAFLQFIQGKAAKKKFKEIVFTKLAELITKLRELKIQFAVENTAQRTTIQMLQREVDELKHKLRNSAASASETFGDGQTTSQSNAAPSRRKLLIKFIDLYAEKQQQHRQSTFLTQTAPSDVLVSNALTFEPCERETFDISNCSLEDDEISEVLVKIQVSGVQFHELRLDSNALSDTGAQYLANFLEKCPPGLKVVSVDGNSAITYHGIEALKRGLLRNPSVHRIEVDPSGQVVDALAAQDEYELHGRPTVALRLFLPKTSSQTRHEATHRASEEDVERMMDRMHQLGFSDLFVKRNMPSKAAFSIYSAAVGETRKKRAVGSSNGNRHLVSVAPTAASTATTRRQAVRRQQEQKFHHLEAAIKRATTSSSSSVTQSQTRPRSTATSRPRSMITSSRPSSGVSVSLTQSFTSRLARLSASTLGSSSAIYGNAHLATVRKLQR